MSDEDFESDTGAESEVEGHDHDHGHGTAPAIEESFVPVRREGLGELDTDLGLVLFTPEGDTVRLNATASILWQFFDGQVTVGELVDDVAAVYDLSRGEVVGDVTTVVSDLVMRRVVLHPSIDLGPDPSRHAADGSLYRPDGCTPCGQHLEERAWEGFTVLAVGGHHLGIRSSHSAIDEALRAMLAPYVVDDPEAPNDFSIWLDAGDGSGAPTIDLFDYHASIWRGASAASIRAVLLTCLARYAGTTEMLWVRGSAAIGPKGAYLIPPQLGGLVSFAANRLSERDVAIATPLVAVDPVSQTVVVGHPGLDVSSDTAKAFDQLSDWEDPGPSLATPGRYPIAHWGLLPPHRDTPTSPVDAVAAAVSAIDNLAELGTTNALALLNVALNDIPNDLPDEDTDVIDHIVERIT